MRDCLFSVVDFSMSNSIIHLLKFFIETFLQIFVATDQLIKHLKEREVFTLRHLNITKRKQHQYSDCLSIRLIKSVLNLHTLKCQELNVSSLGQLYQTHKNKQRFPVYLIRKFIFYLILISSYPEAKRQLNTCITDTNFTFLILNNYLNTFLILMAVNHDWFEVNCYRNGRQSSWRNRVNLLWKLGNSRTHNLR